jgi:hypothetical protein
MSGAISPLPNTPSWRGAQKKSTRTTLLYLYVERIEKMRNAYKILVGKHDGKRPLGRHTHEWGIILEWILGKYGGRVWTGCMWLRIGTTVMNLGVV